MLETKTIQTMKNQDYIIKEVEKTLDQEFCIGPFRESMKEIRQRLLCGFGITALQIEILKVQGIKVQL